MSHKESTFSLLGTNEKRNALAGDKILVLGAGLLALVLAAIALLLMPLAAPEGSPVLVPGVGVGPAHWCSVAASHPARDEHSSLTPAGQVAIPANVALIGYGPVAAAGVASSGPQVAQAIFPGQAQARSLASIGPMGAPANVALIGYGPVAAAGVTSSGPQVAQTIFPGQAQARSLAPAGQVATPANVALVGYGPISAAGVAPAGPQIAQAIFPGQAQARSLALAGQEWAGPVGAPPSALLAVRLIHPDEAYAYSRALIGQACPVAFGLLSTGSEIAPANHQGETYARRMASSAGLGWIGPAGMNN